MIEGLIARFGLKIFSSGVVLIALVVLIPAIYFVHGCRQKSKDKALTQHNNQKAEKYITKESDSTKPYQQSQKIEGSKPAGLHSEKILYDKECLQKSKNKKDCKIALPDLSPQERMERREKHFTDIESGLL